MSSALRALSASALVLALAASAAADTPAEGFALSSQPYPGQSLTATLSKGEVVSFDGLTIDLWGADGSFLQNLATFPGFVFGSFVVADPSESFVLVGESLFGDLYTVDLTAGGLTFVANLNFNFDADFEDATHAIVSAATGGFGTGNDVFRLDVTTGATTLLAHVDGPSGPVDLDPAGNLYYATQDSAFPATPGSTDVLFWSAAQLTGSPVLSAADALLFGTGFDGGSSLVVDPNDDGVYLAENNSGTGVNRIARVNGSAAASPTIVDGLNWISGLELAPGTGGALFLGYQPELGGTLHYNATDFFAVFERVELTPARPTTGLSGTGLVGAGPLDVNVTGGVPNGFFQLAYGLQSLYDPNETLVPHVGGPPLFTGLDLATIQVWPTVYPLDASGAGSVTFLNPGTWQGKLAIQALVFDASVFPVGTSTASLN